MIAWRIAGLVIGLVALAYVLSWVIDNAIAFLSRLLEIDE